MRIQWKGREREGVREGGREVSFCILLVDNLQEKLKDGRRRATQRLFAQTNVFARPKLNLTTIFAFSELRKLGF